MPVRVFRPRELALAHALAALLGIALPVAAGATVIPSGFADSLVVSGLAMPVGMAFLPDRRLLLVEQKSARIRLLVNGALSPGDPVATLPGVETAGAEQGLLGIAVDPGWPARPYLYVHLDDTGGFIRISRYTASGDLSFTSNGALSVDPASRYDLVSGISDVHSNHNGGTLRFGLDGRLYDSLGDDALFCPAQDLTSLLGKILRLDVSRLPAGPGSAPRALVAPSDNPFAASPDSNARLVWSYGLRNPFRFQVDAADGSLWIADVGENTYEEMDHAAAGGRNFGWPIYEGPLATGSGCAGTQGDAPIYSYDRSGTSAAIISGGAYHRPAGASRPFPPEYEGDVFLSDYYPGFVRRLKLLGGVWAIAPAVPGQPSSTNWGTGFDAVSDWQIGPDGSMWYCRQAVNFAANTGQIRRIVNLAPVIAVPAGEARGVRLLPPRPNPSGDAVTLRWSLPRPGPVSLAIFDPSGRRVRAWRLPAGAASELAWDGTDDHGEPVRSGLFFARLEFDGSSQQQSFVRLR